MEAGPLLSWCQRCVAMAACHAWGGAPLCSCCWCMTSGLSGVHVITVLLCHAPAFNSYIHTASSLARRRNLASVGGATLSVLSVCTESIKHQKEKVPNLKTHNPNIGGDTLCPPPPNILGHDPRTPFSYATV